MIAPAWFLRDLEIIDKSYFPAWNEKLGLWEIKKKMHEYHLFKGFFMEIKDPTIGVFKELNNNALDNIRERRRLSVLYPGDKYFKWVLAQAQQSRQKKNQLAVEMATEGIMKIVNFGKSKQFDMKVPES